MMDKAEAISQAVHEIKWMVECAQRAKETLSGAGDNGVFQMPADDANLLDFAICDIEKRVKALQKEIDGC
jgi:hypothetical protein